MGTRRDSNGAVFANLADAQASAATYTDAPEVEEAVIATAARYAIVDGPDDTPKPVRRPHVTVGCGP